MMSEIPLPGNKTELPGQLDPLIYGDIFHYPLALEEMHKFCSLDLTLEEFEKTLKENEDFKKLASCEEGYYFLTGQDHLVEIRKKRKIQSEKAWKTARRVVKYIKYVPFIRGILVTGSLAVNNVRKEDDLDFLVFVRANRLWFVFFILGMLQRIFSRRFLCPNYYISEAHLALPRRSLYVARETIQARPIFGTECCRSFYAQNRWIAETFPNVTGVDDLMEGEDAVDRRRGLAGALCRAKEWLFGGSIGDFVESILKKALKRRLTNHYGKHNQPVPEEVMRNALDEKELRFHGLNHEQMINDEIEARKRRLQAILDDHEAMKNGDQA
ncbi:MAG: hypothetical protein ACYTG7_20790 [Planctomycetota bacterium]|jgi:hypothetical protein